MGWFCVCSHMQRFSYITRTYSDTMQSAECNPHLITHYPRVNKLVIVTLAEFPKRI